jgi:signal peptidase I
VTEPDDRKAAANEDGRQAVAGPDEPKTNRSFLRELPVLLLVAFVLALLIKTFLVQAFYIPSGSMEDTLTRGDRVLVNRVVYRLHSPRRGDVIVFSDPNADTDRGALSAFWHWLVSGFGLPGSEEDFIKRVIGLAGETVEIKDCVVYVDGTALREPYVMPANNQVQCGYGPVRVPKDSLLVLGDNRDHSGDSRFGLGFIPLDKVIGRAFVVLWPPSRIGWLRGS